MSQHKILATFLVAATLSACDSDKNLALVDINSGLGVVVATRAADYSSGAHSALGTSLPAEVQNSLDPVDTSDVVIRGGAGHFFRLQRFGSDSISRYEADAPGTPTYTYSTNSVDDGNSNPYDIIEVSETKAYVLRYGSVNLWVVNPSAETEAEFFVSAIDLSHHNNENGAVPRMAAAVLQNDRLFIGLQRLNGSFKADVDSRVVIIDVTTDAEIDTDAGTEGVQGIDLPIRNISSLQEVPGNGEILALAAGGFDDSFAPLYDGGLAKVDPVNLTASLVLDDGDTSSAPYGQFVGLAVASADKAYLVGSPAFGTATLFEVDLQAGIVANDGAAVAGLESQGLGAIGIDSEGRLWVSRTDASAPGLTVLAADDSVLVELIDTVLVPNSLSFMQ